MPTREVQLSDDNEALIQEGVASGRYQNADEAIAIALYLLEREQEDEAEKLEWLRNAAQEAIDSLERGEGMTFESVDALGDYIMSRAERLSTTGRRVDKAA